MENQEQKHNIDQHVAISSAYWKIVAHSHQIADTGDYDGCYEVTNGKVSLFTKDDDDEAIGHVVKALNESGINFYIDDSDKWELQSIRDENKRLYYMIENGLGWDDIKNDVKYPTEL